MESASRKKEFTLFIVEDFREKVKSKKDLYFMLTHQNIMKILTLYSPLSTPTISWMHHPVSQRSFGWREQGNPSLINESIGINSRKCC